MGREIRRVVADWEHPKNYRGQYQPMRNKSVEQAWEEWIAEWQRISVLSKFEQEKELSIGLDSKLCLYEEFCHYHGTPPNPEYYRPSWNDADATWLQVYETVSEGTPVTPPFATAYELIHHLCHNGTFWDNKSWAVDVATRFVNESGWMPSGAFVGGLSVDLTQQNL
jgi:hypothetical protein